MMPPHLSTTSEKETMMLDATLEIKKPRPRYVNKII